MVVPAQPVHSLGLWGSSRGGGCSLQYFGVKGERQGICWGTGSVEHVVVAKDSQGTRDYSEVSPCL